MCGLESCVWDHSKYLISGQCVAALGPGKWGLWRSRGASKPRYPLHLSSHVSQSAFQHSGLPRIRQASFKPRL